MLRSTGGSTDCTHCRNVDGRGVLLLHYTLPLPIEHVYDRLLDCEPVRPQKQSS